MPNFTFTADSITVAGKTFPASYLILPAGAVIVLATVPGTDEVQRVRFNQDHPEYPAAAVAAISAGEKAPEGHPAALAAAQAERDAHAAQAEERETIPEGYTATTTAAGHVIAVQRNEYAAEAEPAAEPTPEAAATETPAPAPKKDFIGQTITGNGWRILFDGETSRTRVIFDAAPTAAAAAALEKAGFYFSKAMNSYNKKLTHKAHRAAVALSGELRALYA